MAKKEQDVPVTINWKKLVPLLIGLAAGTVIGVIAFMKIV